MAYKYSRDQVLDIKIAKSGDKAKARVTRTGDHPWVAVLDDEGKPDMQNYPRPLAWDRYEIIES